MMSTPADSNDAAQKAKTLFEASDLSRFCETDVATIYTWVKRGSIEGFRTPGGHLRFERCVVLDFLRRFHFPIPPELTDGKPRVIVIEKDAEWLGRIRSALSNSFDVEIFDDVYDGLLAIGHTKPDAVLVDTQTRSFDAPRFIARARANAHLRHMRIIVFTSRDSDRQTSLEAGAAAFVTKPNLAELHRSLHRLFA